MEIQAYNDAVVRDFVIYAEPVNNSDFVYSEEQRPESIYTETKRFRRFAYGN